MTTATDILQAAAANMQDRADTYAIADAMIKEREK